MVCAAAFCLAVLMLTPPLTRGLWLARLVVSEFSLVLVLVAASGLIALDRRPGSLVFRILGTGALVAGLAPPVAALPAFSAHGRSFSLADYFTWGPAHPPVERRQDLALEPSRPDLLLDLYQGHGARPGPLIVLVHGGSFSGGDKGENRAVSELFAASGYSVADVRYRLAPKDPFPLAIQDVKCLTGRLRERASEFGIDPARVAYLGRSAGAAIAIIAAYSAGDPRIPPACPVADAPVQAMVSLYGPLDLEWGWRQRPFADPIVGYKVLERYLGGTPDTNPGAYRLASATTWPGPAVPATLLIHGSRDSLVLPRHMDLLAEAARARGLDPPRRLLVPFAEHGFDYHPGGFGEQLARAEILEFLGQALRTH